MWRDENAKAQYLFRPTKSNCENVGGQWSLNPAMINFIITFFKHKGLIGHEGKSFSFVNVVSFVFISLPIQILLVFPLDQHLTCDFLEDRFIALNEKSLPIASLSVNH